MLPHVMKYEEILEAARNHKPIWEESRNPEYKIRKLIFDGSGFISKREGTYLLLMECDEEVCEDYNFYYRCWNKRPSVEFMKNIPWKESRSFE